MKRLFLLAFCFILTNAVEGYSQTAPTLEETKEWIIEKLNTYSTAYEGNLKSFSMMMPNPSGTYKFYNFRFSDTGTELLIECSYVASEKYPDEWSIVIREDCSYSCPWSKIEMGLYRLNENQKEVRGDVNALLALLSRNKLIHTTGTRERKTYKIGLSPYPTIDRNNINGYLPVFSLSLKVDDDMFERFSKAIVHLNNFNKKSEKF